LFQEKNPQLNIHNTLFVARPGLIFILIALGLILVLWILGLELLRNIFILVFLFVVWFFRDPHRPTPPGSCGLSPADGRVIRILEDEKNPVNGQKATKVSIFMNIFSVHVNRAPISGIVKDQIYHRGTLVNASLDKASLNNERNILLLEDQSGRELAMVQIAGLIARRIVSWVRPGDSITRGERFGMIRFGSRVDLYLPPEAEVMVALGQNVQAGTTPIWQYPEAK
jgi:phosphatidylserine decarboxylase